MQISNPKELAHAYKFLANYNLKKENFEEAYIAAQKCIDYPEVIMSCLPIKLGLTIINKLSAVIKCFKMIYSTVFFHLLSRMPPYITNLCARTNTFHIPLHIPADKRGREGITESDHTDTRYTRQYG